MNDLPPLEELLAVDLRAFHMNLGLPHPLSKFGIGGRVEDGFYADVVLHFIQVTVMEDDPDSNRHDAAMWFLLESQRTYFFACGRAGIDGIKLREHLRDCFERNVL
jgi:hypothetical protein